ncbi:MAG: hypothetical protein L0229_31605 [Blastocatellia bacterium]|nr:hypothetical protein [Blastocatellia bacterium]
MSFQPENVLFDKGVIRRIYEFRVRLAFGLPPTPQQVEASRAFAHLSTFASRMCITQQTANILQRRPARFAAAILNDTQTLNKGRYLRRWARRLRGFAFSPEDAVMIAYGSFGVDVHLQKAGIDAVVTNDLKLAANFHTRYLEIDGRFAEMVQNLSDPHRALKLPRIITVAEVLTGV